MIKFGVMMELPEGKLPGYYAQIVKALAGTVQLFDRDKELLIVDTSEQQHAVTEVMERFRVPYELLLLRLIPADTLSAAAADYGFTSKSGNSYLYDQLIAVFQLEERSVDTPDEAVRAEPEQALLQLQEHVLMRFLHNDKLYYVIEKHLAPLAEGIANVYGCRAIFD